MTRPKDAAHKRNHNTIRGIVRSPILRKLKDTHYRGVFLSLLDDVQLAELADLVTSAVMHNESLAIALKNARSKAL